MHASEYQILAMRTRGHYVNKADQSKCALLGLAGELGEYIDLRKKMMYHNRAIEFQELEKELGDIFWYIALEADALGMNLDTVLGKNIEKLNIRYPEGFSYSRANNPNRDSTKGI